MKMFKRERYFFLILVFFFHSFFLCVNGKHFVLVHGSFHGAWCWYKVANQLKSVGHNVTTLDMAAAGINPKHTQDVNSISEYHEPLITFLASLPPKKKVILVGHSLGGLSVSVAMEKYPQKISVAVFITAAVVSQNLTFAAYSQEVTRKLGPILAQPYFILNGVNKAPTLSSLGIKLLTSRLYQLSPSESSHTYFCIDHVLSALGLSHYGYDFSHQPKNIFHVKDLTLGFSLVRPLPPFMNDVKLLMKQTAVTKYKNGRVSKVFIISEKDNSIPEDLQRWTIESTGPYVEVTVIKDSDHMVMFSKPKKLSYELLKIAYKY